MSTVTSLNLEGRIDVRLRVDDARVTGVEIRSSRPQLAQRLMAGHTPDEAARLAGQVFSLCGRAQAAAARAACAAAEDRIDTRTGPLEIAVELAREHAWRLLLDWPQETGHAPDMSSLLALRQAAAEDFAETLEVLLRERLLGETPAAWLARDAADFDAWRQAGTTLPARLCADLTAQPAGNDMELALLPALSDWQADAAAELARRALDEPAFCARPDWQGAPAETGALARVQPHPLLAAWLGGQGRDTGARLIARLLELAALPARLRAGNTTFLRAWTLAPGVGVAGVETARGLLFHVTRLARGRVADYRILAPTEWNFHPAGALVRALTALPAGADLTVRARLIARALDPCVDFGLEVVDA